MNRNLLRILLLLLLASAITLAAINREQLSGEALQGWIDGLGWFGPLAFMALYALATVLFLPGSLITLAGGAIFGPVWGTLYNLTGATFGATLAFLVSRFSAAEWVERRAAGRLGQLKRGVEAEGWRFVAFVRLVPLFPFNVLNYALGLTRIPLLHYLIATWLFMLPGAIAYTYLGYAGREALAGGEGTVQKGLLALALLALVAFLPRLIGRLRQRWLEVAELRQRLAGEGAPLLLDVRSGEEFVGELGHIDGAHNIPLDQLSARLDELNEWRERPIVIICRTDVRSSQAARLLAAEGFTDVTVMRRGMTAWKESGQPVARH